MSQQHQPQSFVSITYNDQMQVGQLQKIKNFDFLNGFLVHVRFICFERKMVQPIWKFLFIIETQTTTLHILNLLKIVLQYFPTEVCSTCPSLTYDSMYLISVISVTFLMKNEYWVLMNNHIAFHEWLMCQLLCFQNLKTTSEAIMNMMKTSNTVSVQLYFYYFSCLIKELFALVQNAQ